MPIYFIPTDEIVFPHPEEANENGILGVGGDLSPERLLLAYENGIFPWFNEGDPIMWWSPDPRFVLFPSQVKISKSMRSYFNQKKYRTTYDTEFEAVIRNCQNIKRQGQSGTWLTEDMIDAYIDLHDMGFAHSVEVWDHNNKLVGGLYGVCLGKCFFGESMFAKKSNASKFGFISLCKELEKRQFKLIDCQQETDHLASMGAVTIPRKEFLEILEENKHEEILIEHWDDWAEK